MKGTQKRNYGHRRGTGILAILTLLTAAIVLAAHALPRQNDADPLPAQGRLLLIGGGTTPPAAVRAFIKAAGGPEAPLVILAQTEEDAAEGAPLSAAQFREQGALHVEAPVNLPPAQIVSLLEKARGVWIPGGDQNRFASVFPESSGVPAAIRAVCKRGGVAGGTSAGASLLGDLMPTGAQTAASGLQAGACPVAPGLRALPHAIVDQHFLTRNRMLRLLTAVLEHPQYTGVGLDEGAWAIIQNHNLRVEEGQVMLLRASGKVRRQGTRLGADSISLRVLLPGESASIGK